MQDTKKRGRKFGRELALMIALVVAGLAAIAVYARHEFGDVDLGFNGYLAFTLGAVFTAIVGVALMALLFFSNRYGYDEDVGTRDRKPPQE